MVHACMSINTLIRTIARLLEGKKNHRKLITSVKMVCLKTEKMIVWLPENCIFFFVVHQEH